jgi:hypothetical protein
MSDPQSDPQSDPILRALRELPRETASPDFTARVVERAGSAESAESAESDDRETPRLPRAVFAAAAALVLVSGAAAWRLEKERSREAWLDQVQAMQLESARLQRELVELRAAETPPILYLGGDDQVDLFLDLAEGPRARGAQPASVSTSQVNRGDQL